MRALDQYTIETLGVPGDLVMESAGRAVAHEVLRSLGPGEEVVIVCGRGNNGGRRSGRRPAILHLLGCPSPGRVARGAPASCPATRRETGNARTRPAFRSRRSPMVAADCGHRGRFGLLGTGLSRDVKWTDRRSAGTHQYLPAGRADRDHRCRSAVGAECGYGWGARHRSHGRHHHVALGSTEARARVGAGAQPRGPHRDCPHRYCRFGTRRSATCSVVDEVDGWPAPPGTSSRGATRAHSGTR